MSTMNIFSLVAWRRSFLTSSKVEAARSHFSTPWVFGVPIFPSSHRNDTSTCTDPTNRGSRKILIRPRVSRFFPWFNSDGYVGMAKKVGEPMPEKMTRADAIAFNGFEMRSYLDVPYRGTIAVSRQLELLQAYAACISYVDAQVGKILAALEKTGERDNTIVLLWSDHGWHLGEMSAWGKMTNYESRKSHPADHFRPLAAKRETQRASQNSSTSIRRSAIWQA
jgi:hypothetical protein